MRFLSDEWFAAADRIAQAGPRAGPSAPPTVIEYRVDRGNGEVCVYQLVLGGDQNRVTAGSTRDPDAVLALSYATAAGISSGELQAYEAIRRGLVKVSGRANALVACQSDLRQLNDSLRTLAAGTEY